MEIKHRISAFVDSHPGGWNHQDWLDLLGELERAGLDVSEPEAVGLELEKERTTRVLEHAEVRGLGPKRVQALVDRYQTLWRLSQASVEDVAEIKTIPSALADQIVRVLHSKN